MFKENHNLTGKYLKFLQHVPNITVQISSVNIWFNVGVSKYVYFV